MTPATDSNRWRVLLVKRECTLLFYPKIYMKPQAGQTMHDFQAKTVKMRLTSLQIQ